MGDRGIVITPEFVANLRLAASHDRAIARTTLHNATLHAAELRQRAANLDAEADRLEAEMSAG